MMAGKAMRRLLVAACLVVAAPAWAGRSCEETPMSVAETVKSMDLAQRTFEALDASGSQVALVSRAGQDLSKYGLHYSHMGIVVRDHPAGRWTVVHELNECGTAASALYNEGLGNFFLSGLFRHDAQVVIPGPEAQARLAQLVTTRTARRLHDADYNMLSYAWSTRYQNSNQWVLETYAAASAPAGQVETREEAQAWLKQTGFAPITVYVPSVKRLGGRMFRANVAFDDHPFGRRMAGQIDTITTDAIVRYVQAVDPAAKVITVE
ncbi:DUF2145 domain-containing protein [Pseudoduganella sp. SL102]|uniref:Membrane protein n=2 Tax=Pseudoduganella albidiflava TaxID=321983 RepID=A0AA88C3B9_9BURK|nr:MULTISPECIES: DUF2145 domain-containing protein [Pseudoduganella]WBS02313.1 DUF2145 domain-containing protein [Pseudoduganella sp. SL102]GGY46934.1 membrane protein [Pseudoduganella albidiflava]